MAWVLVRHKVKDYATWRPHFDGPEALLRGSGAEGGRVVAERCLGGELQRLHGARGVDD
jgi:hypothetical protein